MPQRFVGHRLPPILYAQPLECALAAILVFVGAAMSIDAKYTPASISELSWPWSILFRGLVVSAGLFMAAGLLRGKHRWSFTAEMAGFVMGATVFGTYAAGLFSLGSPAALLSCATNAVFAVACAVKARALWIEAHNRLQLIKELPLPPADQADVDGGN